MSQKNNSPKLDFIFVGPQKSGTTWFYENLKDHDFINLPTPPIKETFYFDYNFDKGEKWFFDYYNISDGIIGEIAPSYFDTSECPERIYNHNKDCKIIIGLRDPLLLVHSYHKHCLKKGIVKSFNLKNAIEEEPRIITIAQYKKHIQKWEQHFLKEQLFLYSFNSIKNEPEKIISEVCSFLNLKENNSNLQQSKLTQTVNEGYIPKYPYIQKAKRFTFTMLRKMKLNRMIKIGSFFSNRLDLLTNNKNYSKKLIYTQEDYRFLENLLKEDIEYYYSITKSNSQ